jgi:hypothetical protein
MKMPGKLRAAKLRCIRQDWPENQVCRLSPSKIEKRNGNATPCQMGPDPWRGQFPFRPPGVKGRYALGSLGDCLSVPIFCLNCSMTVQPLLAALPYG